MSTDLIALRDKLLAQQEALKGSRGTLAERKAWVVAHQDLACSRCQKLNIPCVLRPNFSTRCTECNLNKHCSRIDLARLWRAVKLLHIDEKTYGTLVLVYPELLDAKYLEKYSSGDAQPKKQKKRKPETGLSADKSVETETCTEKIPPIRVPLRSPQPVNTEANKKCNAIEENKNCKLPPLTPAQFPQNYASVVSSQGTYMSAQMYSVPPHLQRTASSSSDTSAMTILSRRDSTQSFLDYLNERVSAASSVSMVPYNPYRTLFSTVPSDGPASGAPLAASGSPATYVSPFSFNPSASLSSDRSFPSFDSTTSSSDSIAPSSTSTIVEVPANDKTAEPSWPNLDREASQETSEACPSLTTSSADSTPALLNLEQKLIRREPSHDVELGAIRIELDASQASQERYKRKLDHVREQLRESKVRERGLKEHIQAMDPFADYFYAVACQRKLTQGLLDFQSDAINEDGYAAVVKECIVRFDKIINRCWDGLPFDGRAERWDDFAAVLAQRRSGRVKNEEGQVLLGDDGPLTKRQRVEEPSSEVL